MTLKLQSALRMLDEQTIAGYVFNEAHPGRKFVVEILLDEIPIAAIRADGYSPTLASAGLADANYAFIYTAATPLLQSSRFITARLANLGTAVGKRIDLEQRSSPDPMLAAQGAVESVDGLAVDGWINGPANGVALVRAEIGGEEVAATIARNWSSRIIGGKARPVLLFSLHLPRAIATGESHLVTISNANGSALANSPVRVDTAPC